MTKKKPSNAYWKKRGIQDKKKVLRVSEHGITDLKKLLKTNLDDVQKKIKAFYEKYGDNPAEKLSYAEFQKYKAELKRKARLNPQDRMLQKIAKQDIPKYRIDRLRALETDIQFQLTEITRGQEKGIYKTLKDVAKVSQATTLARFSDVDLAFHKLNDKKIQKLLSSNWSGKSWSKRIWDDRKKLGEKVQTVLEKGIPQGTSLQTMSRELADLTHQSFNNAFRLMRTESAYIDGQVLLDSFKQAQRELGYEYYIYDATIDNRTSDICKDLDGKRFKISEAEIGVNFPPSHPSCRSTCVLDENSINEDLIVE